MNFFKLYIGDYQRDTAHLSVTEHGAYMLMLQHYYATEKPLPTGKALHRMLRAQDKAEREAIDAVAAQFWTATDAGLVNGRADKEIERADHQRTVNREIGKRGGRPKSTESKTESVTESVSESEPSNNPNQTPDTRHQTKDNPPTPRKRGSVFDAAGIELPEWLQSEDWGEWCADRKARGKPITEAGARQQLAKLADYRKQGHAPGAVIAHSIAGGYQGLYPPPQRNGGVQAVETAYQRSMREKVAKFAPSIAAQPPVSGKPILEVIDVAARALG